MHFSTHSAVAAALSTAALLAPMASAQTPDGFTPSVSQKLSVTYGSTAVDPAGKMLEKAQTATIPTLASGSGALNGTKFLFMMIDLDVPMKSGNTITGRQTLLHAMVGNFTADAQGKLTSTSLDQAPAKYIGPSPPAENPPKPHRYTQLLFAQPDNFSVPASQAAVVQKRIGFDAASFIKAAGLGQPIQGNFFQVVNNGTAKRSPQNSEGGKSGDNGGQSGGDGGSEGGKSGGSGGGEGGKSGGDGSGKGGESGGQGGSEGGKSGGNGGGKGGESGSEGGKSGGAGGMEGGSGGGNKTTSAAGKATGTGGMPMMTGGGGRGGGGGGGRASSSGAPMGTGVPKATGGGSGGGSGGGMKGTGTGSPGRTSPTASMPAMFTGAAETNNARNKLGAAVLAGAALLAL